MKLDRKQWFGIITLIVLIIAAYLVTAEPWKKSSGELQRIEKEPLPSE